MAGKKDINYIWTDKKRTIFGLPLSFTRYFLTETKFITRTGFLNLEEDELDLYTVTDKKLVLPLGQRIFKCGTIVLYVVDTDTPVKEIKAVKAPRKVLELLDKHINIQRDRYRTRGRDLIGGNMYEQDHYCDDSCCHDDCDN
ncbi:PH domain-containing protein [Porcipelethomonas sp.]|uniref:PH domain-containing protein n=1 Tax=Porcipelethomonas sp. TaxID=2981675 RepID=UPI003EF5FC78